MALTSSETLRNFVRKTNRTFLDLALTQTQTVAIKGL